MHLDIINQLFSTMNLLKKLFGKGKTEVKEYSENFVVATLNDKVMPIDRGDIYEDPLDEFLKENYIGKVTGGGTMQLESGELQYCDIEIKIESDEIDSHIPVIIRKLEELGAPKGSKITIEKTKQKIEFGIKEGLAIYLDGVNLDKEVYKSSDSNFVVSEIKRLIGDKTEIVRFWENNFETALYFYSDSFISMNNSIKDFVKEYPLCKGARIEQIA